jgi:hypothetical protein
MEPKGSVPRSKDPATDPKSHMLPRPFQRIRPSPRPCAKFRNKLFPVFILYGEELLTPHPNQSSTVTLCRLSATVYSIYSQQTSTPGGRLLHPQTEDAPCRGDSDITMASLLIRCYQFLLVMESQLPQKPTSYNS